MRQYGGDMYGGQFPYMNMGMMGMPPMGYVSGCSGRGCKVDPAGVFTRRLPPLRSASRHDGRPDGVPASHDVLRLELARTLVLRPPDISRQPRHRIPTARMESLRVHAANAAIRVAGIRRVRRIAGACISGTCERWAAGDAVGSLGPAEPVEVEQRSEWRGCGEWEAGRFVISVYIRTIYGHFFYL